MATIEIPEADFNFSDIIKRKAEQTCKLFLSDGTLTNVAYGYKGNVQNVTDSIEQEYYSIRSHTDRIIYVSELITHLYTVKRNHKPLRQPRSNIGDGGSLPPTKDFENMANEILYFLYNLSAENGYTFDRNAFSESELESLNTKIDDILAALEKVQVGQEVIFDFVDELKSDFASLKSDLPLGKKRWHQRAAGIFVSYAGTKGADEIFAAIRPDLANLISKSPEFISKLLDQ